MSAKQDGEQDPLANFMYALRAPETKRQWPRRLKIVLDFLRLEGSFQEQAKKFVVGARENPQSVHDSLMRFFSYQIERSNRKEISETTIPNYYKSVKLFCEMNDLVFNWKKISRILPRRRNAANDRAPTIEEIRRLTEYPDRRIKPIVYTMVSSGIRLGAWDYLQWKHVVPVSNEEGKIIAARLVIYAGDREEYHTLTTPEAYQHLKDWMDFRGSYGEKITPASWVMCDLWQTTNVRYGFRNGLATCPRRLKSTGVKRLIERALWEQGLRKPLLNGQRRHEWKAAHGFRKFFKSRAEQVMRPANVEILMGHDIGISSSYYKPTEQEILGDYLKVVDLLSVSSGDKIMLQKQVIELKEKSRDSEYLIRGKLQEKDEEIGDLRQQFVALQSQVQSLVNLVMNTKDQARVDELGKNLYEANLLKNVVPPAHKNMYTSAPT